MHVKLFLLVTGINLAFAQSNTCLPSGASVTVQSSQYHLASTTNTFLVSPGDTQLNLQVDAHPVRIFHDKSNANCEPTWSTGSGGGKTSDSGFVYYTTGNWTVTFPSHSDCLDTTYSLTCQYHGYMSGKSRLMLSSTCLSSSGHPPPPPSPPVETFCLTEVGCFVAALRAGLTLGTINFEFARDWGPHSSKGCYYYEGGPAYFGRGGSTEDMTRTLPGQQLRLMCYEDGHGFFKGNSSNQDCSQVCSNNGLECDDSQGDFQNYDWWQYVNDSSAVRFVNDSSTVQVLYKALGYSFTKYVYAATNSFKFKNSTSQPWLPADGTRNFDCTDKESGYENVCWCGAVSPPPMLPPSRPPLSPPSSSPSSPPNSPPPPLPVSPPSPNPPLSPPPPEESSYTVRFTLTIAGDQDSFDKDSFKRNIANVTDTDPENIQVTVTSGSVIVDTSIVSTGYTQASKAEAVLASVTGNLTAATKLFGVQVEEMSTVSLATTAPPPPVAPPAPMSPIMISVLVLVGVLSLVALGFLVYLFYKLATEPSKKPRNTALLAAFFKETEKIELAKLTAADTTLLKMPPE